MRFPWIELLSTTTGTLLGVAAGLDPDVAIITGPLSFALLLVLGWLTKPRRST